MHTAEEILEKMMRRYASASTYTDSGHLVHKPSRFGGGDSQIIFRTVFVRPDRIFVERTWSQNELDYRSVLWSKSGRIFSYTESTTSKSNDSIGKRCKTVPTLEMAFYEATDQGASILYAMTLLVPSLRSQASGFFDNIFTLADDADESADSFDLMSMTAPHRRVNLAIRRDDYALKKITIARHEPPVAPMIPEWKEYSCEQMQFDEAVPEEFFAFEPKETAGA